MTLILLRQPWYCDKFNPTYLHKFIFLDQIEAIMNDFIQLKPQSNVYEAETMVEGQDFITLSLDAHTRTHICAFTRLP